MKVSGDTSTITKGGLGETLNVPPDPWFRARISAVSTDGSQNIYELTEVEPILDDYGYQDVNGGLVVPDCYELNNATVDVDAVVLARFRAWAVDGKRTYEFTTGGGGASDTFAGFVHVVQNWDSSGGGSFTGNPYFERVEFVGNVWPPVPLSPPITYGGPDDDTTIFESENRNFRLIDKVGDVTDPVSHIEPAWRSTDGSVFIVFWVTNTFQDIDMVDPDTTTWEQTCVDGVPTITPSAVTKRFALTVTPPGTATTGLTFTITDAP